MNRPVLSYQHIITLHKDKKEIKKNMKDIVFIRTILIHEIVLDNVVTFIDITNLCLTSRSSVKCMSRYYTYYKVIYLDREKENLRKRNLHVWNRFTTYLFTSKFFIDFYSFKTKLRILLDYLVVSNNTSFTNICKTPNPIRSIRIMTHLVNYEYGKGNIMQGPGYHYSRKSLIQTLIQNYRHSDDYFCNCNYDYDSDGYDTDYYIGELDYIDYIDKQPLTFTLHNKMTEECISGILYTEEQYINKKLYNTTAYNPTLRETFHILKHKGAIYILVFLRNSTETECIIGRFRLKCKVQ